MSRLSSSDDSLVHLLADRARFVHERRSASGEEIRHDLVNRIRKEIAAGIYDTEEKWRIAEERLFAQLFGDDSHW